MAYAKTIIEGNIARLDDLTQTKNGHDVLNFAVAVDRDFNKDGVTDFYNITAWRKLAENVAKLKSVGDPVLVEGRMNFDSYEKEGQKIPTATLVADRVVFLRGSKGEGGGGGGNNAPQSGNTEDVPF